MNTVLSNDKTIPIETQVFLGLVIPENFERVIYNPVKENHMVWDNTIRDYRRPYSGECGKPLRDFLCVIREKR